MDTATRVPFLDKADNILQSANIFGKSMNPTILPSAMAKTVGQTGLFGFGVATGLGEGKL